MYHALIEARMPFEMLHDRTLERAGRFKLLLLPNIAALSARQCGRSGLRRERRQRPGDLRNIAFRQKAASVPTSDLPSVRRLLAKDARRADPNSYLRVEESGRRHPRMKGLEDAELLINGTYQLEVEPTAQFEPPFLTAIPQYPSLPMEKNIRGVKKTDTARSLPAPRGKGRVVYFPWDIDRVYWEVMVDDHGRLLRNAIDWALDEERPVTVYRPGVLDVTVWKQKNSMTVHLVNLTNPMMMRPSFREMIPSPPQQVRLRLPEGKPRFEGTALGGGRCAGRPDFERRSDADDSIHSRSRSHRRRFLVIGVPGPEIRTSRLDRVPSELPRSSCFGHPWSPLKLLLLATEPVASQRHQKLNFIAICICRIGVL